MPLFEFTCKKCGHNFEDLVTIADLNDGKVKCPACNSKRVERGFSAFATGGSGLGGGLVGGGGGGCGSGGFT